MCVSGVTVPPSAKHLLLPGPGSSWLGALLKVDGDILPSSQWLRLAHTCLMSKLHESPIAQLSSDYTPKPVWQNRDLLNPFLTHWEGYHLCTKWQLIWMRRDNQFKICSKFTDLLCSSQSSRVRWQSPCSCQVSFLGIILYSESFLF